MFRKLICSIALISGTFNAAWGANSFDPTVCPGRSFTYREAQDLFASSPSASDRLFLYDLKLHARVKPCPYRPCDWVTADDTIYWSLGNPPSPVDYHNPYSVGLQSVFWDYYPSETIIKVYLVRYNSKFNASRPITANYTFELEWPTPPLTPLENFYSAQDSSFRKLRKTEETKMISSVIQRLWNERHHDSYPPQNATSLPHGSTTYRDPSDRTHWANVNYTIFDRDQKILFGLYAFKGSLGSTCAWLKLDLGGRYSRETEVVLTNN